MKKIITIIMSFILALCISSAALASGLIHVGYYAILKDKFSPTDPLLPNHLVRYVGQNPEYYRFYSVYTSHNHDSDTYTQYRESMSLSICTVSLMEPVEKVNGKWKEIQDHDINNGSICTGINVKLAGSFGAHPYSMTVYDSVDSETVLYENKQPKVMETLNVNTAIIDVLNITGPHPGWNSKIAGSTGLPY